MTMKVRGTSSPASAYPNSSKRIAKSAETAAAMIPRGAIQLKKILARSVRSEKSVDNITERGRTTKSMIPNSPRADQPISKRAKRSRRAERMIKSTEINNKLKLSLKKSISSVLTFFIFASIIPISVTANNPDS